MSCKHHINNFTRSVSLKSSKDVLEGSKKKKTKRNRCISACQGEITFCNRQARRFHQEGLFSRRSVLLLPLSSVHICTRSLWYHQHRIWPEVNRYMCFRQMTVSYVWHLIVEINWSWMKGQFLIFKKISIVVIWESTHSLPFDTSFWGWRYYWQRAIRWIVGMDAKLYKQQVAGLSPKN